MIGKMTWKRGCKKSTFLFNWKQEGIEKNKLKGEKKDE